MTGSRRLGNRYRRWGACAAALLAGLVPVVYPLTAGAKPVDKIAAAYAAADWDDAGDYSTYKKTYAEAARPETVIRLTADDNPQLTGKDGETGNTPAIRENYEGEPGPMLELSPEDEVTWSFHVGQEGVYLLKFRYYPIEGEGGSIERAVYLDGTLPFREAESVNLDRVWVNESEEPSYDLQGNQLMVAQKEAPVWREQYAEDTSGLLDEPYAFYLSAGSHTLTLVGVREPLLLSAVSFCPLSEIQALSYADVKAGYEAKGYSRASEEAAVKLQGESATAKSSQMIYPQSDRTSPTVEPYDSTRIRYNTLGGTQWTNAGQWAEWKFYIKESGLYSLAAHFRQALKEGQTSVRELMVDGKLPFAEASAWAFAYKSVWQTGWFADGEGDPYELYLEKGWHTLRLRVGPGYYSDTLEESQSCLTKLNEIYREIVAITGTSPDPYRDYRFDEMIPDTLTAMSEMSARLKALETAVKTRDRDERAIPDIQRLYDQLDMMMADSDTIARRLTYFKSNISSFGTWINEQMGQPLELDWLLVAPAGTKLSHGEASVLGLAWHYLRQFVGSFCMDYNIVGQTKEQTGSSIRVWLNTGRDQAQVLRQLISSDFTPESGVDVDLQLVSSGALLPAVLAGKGPDVSLGMLQADPVNLALRGAMYDLNSFGDLDSVTAEFNRELLVPFQFNGGQYALPETVTYPMLFYRKDILKELGVEVKDLQQWDTLLGLALPKLQENSLSFGVLPSIQNYLMFCYQYGGEVYSESGTKSSLGSSAAIDSMKLYTMLYTQYGLPLTFDFPNRFRTGEIPLAVADFTQYNVLVMFAPEIEGLWGMLPVPGTADENGKISHAAAATVTGSAMLAETDMPQESWSFLKWWVSSETQSAFGKQLESVVGAAARYNTANTTAMKKTAWNADVLQSLMAQEEKLRAYPEVPGGYFTQRLFDFAFRNIVYNGAEVRESMNETVVNIDRELANKRSEYRLD